MLLVWFQMLKPDEKKWLHVRLEIILEQAQAIRAMAEKRNSQVLFDVVSDVRNVVRKSCRKADLTNKEK